MTHHSKKKMPECSNCGEEYNDKRKALGYDICLPCGSQIAYEKAVEKSKRVSPLYNKGGLQYITDGEDLTVVGKKI